MARRYKFRLIKNINLQCLSFLKTYKRFVTQLGTASLETLCLGLSFSTNLAAVAGKYIQYNLLSPILGFKI